jgi:hypothetical protein
VFTVHVLDRRPPALVREGFSLAAFVFGPLWLLAHRAWIAAAIVFGGWLLIGALLHGPAANAAALGLALATGLFAQDWRRWTLSLRGYALSQVVVARDADAALGRLLERRPDYAERLLPPEQASRDARRRWWRR